MIYPETEQLSEAVAQHYNSLDEYYRRLWGEHVHHGYWTQGNESVLEATEKLIEIVADAAGIDEHCLILDVGCGYGATSRYLAKHYGALLSSMTISEAQWNYARSLDPDSENPRYILDDFLQNSLPSQSFDVILSIESSEHMVDKKKFFQEVERLLKPGGRFVTCAWLAKDTPKKWEVKYLLEPICREGRLPSMGSETDYREMMEQANLKQIEFRDISSNVKKTWGICAARTFRAFLTDKEIRRYILDKRSSDRIFAKTLLKIWAAYNTKSMRYGLFTAYKS